MKVVLEVGTSPSLCLLGQDRHQQNWLVEDAAANVLSNGESL